MTALVLVTGATGIVGSHIVRALFEEGYRVRVLIRPTSDLRSLHGLKVERCEGDVLDPASLEPAVKGCAWVFHAAAAFTYGGASAEALMDLAVRGTKNVLHAAKRGGAKRVVVTSSSVVLGSRSHRLVMDETAEFAELQPAAYVLSKVQQEKSALAAAAELGIEALAVCPTLVMGGWDYRLSPSNANIVNYLNDPFRATFLGGCNVVSAEDVARGHLLVALRGKPGQRYLVGSENLNWRQVHALISELAGTFGPSVVLNHTAAYLAAAGIEVASRFSGKRPTVTRDEARMACRFYWSSHAKIAALGYKPRTARVVLADALAWVLERGHISDSVTVRLKLAPEVIAARKRFASVAPRQ